MCRIVEKHSRKRNNRIGELFSSDEILEMKEYRCKSVNRIRIT